jgi:hypothetical protein
VARAAKIDEKFVTVAGLRAGSVIVDMLIAQEAGISDSIVAGVCVGVWAGGVFGGYFGGVHLCLYLCLSAVLCSGLYHAVIYVSVFLFFTRTRIYGCHP